MHFLQPPRCGCILRMPTVITLIVAAIDSCFALTRPAHEHSMRGAWTRPLVVKEPSLRLCHGCQRLWLLLPLKQRGLAVCVFFGLKKDNGRDPFDPKLSGNFGPKLIAKTGSPFEVVHFSQSDRSEFWLNRSRPIILSHTTTYKFISSGRFFSDFLGSVLILLLFKYLKLIRRLEKVSESLGPGQTSNLSTQSNLGRPKLTN